MTAPQQRGGSPRRSTDCWWAFVIHTNCLIDASDDAESPEKSQLLWFNDAKLVKPQQVFREEEHQNLEYKPKNLMTMKISRTGADCTFSPNQTKVSVHQEVRNKKIENQVRSLYHLGAR